MHHATKRFVGRRSLIKVAFGTAFGGLVLASSAVALVRRSGYDLPRAVRLVVLAPWQWLVVRDLARRVCAADAPGVVGPDETDVAGFVDAYVAKMPKRLRRDLLRFLVFIEQAAPLGVGLASRFTRLAPDDQDRVLAALEASSSSLLRGGFDGLKALLFMGYYRDPRTWSVIGYDGPRIKAGAAPTR